MVDKQTYKGYTIEICVDENPQNPRTQFDNAGTMLCFDRRHNLGDKHSYNASDYKNFSELVKAIEENEGEIYFLPLYILDHSGLWMRTGKFVEDSQGWDTSLVGLIYITKAKALEEWGTNTETRALAYLNSEVETYSKYLSGEMYGYIVKDKDGNDTDSCWGYYGIEDAISEARGIIDWNVKAALTARIKKLKNLIQNKVPLIYRTSILA